MLKKYFFTNDSIFLFCHFTTTAPSQSQLIVYTVDSRYLNLAYLE